MPLGAVIVGSVISGAMASNAASDAAEIGAEGTRQSLAQRQKFFDITQEQLAPYRDIGEEAVTKLRDVFVRGDMDKFYTSPEYKFNLQQGEQALERKQGVAGARYGGKSLKEATRYAQGVASNEFNNFFTHLNSIAGMGENAAAGTGNAAMQTGAGMSSDIMSNTQNQMNTTMAGAESLNNAIQGGISNYTTLKTYNDLMSKVGTQVPANVGMNPQAMPGALPYSPNPTSMKTLLQ